MQKPALDSMAEFDKLFSEVKVISIYRGDSRVAVQSMVEEHLCRCQSDVRYFLEQPG
jgi:hypothetical protein